MEAQRQRPSQTAIKKSRTGLNPGTGVATALKRHLLVLCVLYWTTYLLLLSPSGKSGQLCGGLFLKKTSTVSLSIGVRNTMIRWVVYLLQIFKMFHGLMNNPVYKYYSEEILAPCPKLKLEYLPLLNVHDCLFYIIARNPIVWWAGITQSVLKFSTDLTVRRSNPGGTKFSATLQTGPEPLPAFCIKGQCLFPEGKTAGAWLWPPILI